jgi:hypothetical protein
VGTIHGPEVEKRMLAFAKNLAATQGKLPAEALEPGQFQSLMMQYEDAARDLDAFVKTDPIAALGDTKIPPNEVYARVTKPGNGQVLERVVQFIGENSREMGDLRETALRQALSETVYSMNTTTEMTNALQSYLSKYSKHEQELLFPGGMADALRQVGGDIEFLFPKLDDTGMAGMTAGAIQNRMFLRRWWAQGVAALGRSIIDHPGFQEYLIGERTPGKLARGSQTASMQMARFFANEAMSEDTDMPSDAQPQ